MQLHNLTGDVRTDFYLSFGLYLSVGGDSLNDIVESCLFHGYLYCGFLAEPALLLANCGKYYENQYCRHKDLEYFVVFHSGVVLLLHWLSGTYMNRLIS